MLIKIQRDLKGKSCHICLSNQMSYIKEQENCIYNTKATKSCFMIADACSHLCNPLST